MPDLADLIRAEKATVRIDAWTRGNIPRGKFPMSGAKAKAYKFGPTWEWCLVRFSSLDERCRVLILANFEKYELRAAFAVERGQDLFLLCDHEFHGNHPGWHCHVRNGELGQLESGINRLGTRRWPSRRMQDSHGRFVLSKEAALTKVAALYRFERGGPLI